MSSKITQTELGKEFGISSISMGKKLIEKSIGGTKGGGSELTQFGKFFVYQFNAVEEDVKKYALELIKKSFKEFE